MIKTGTTDLHNSYDLPPPLIIRYKVGIYKELYIKGLLTKQQLDALIELQKAKANFSVETKL